MIVVDCARSDKWIGNNRTTFTPYFDRLTEEGLAFSATITEKVVTTPSFVSLLTGLYSPRHGIHQAFGYRLSGEVPLLTTPLGKMGYHRYAEVTGPLLPEMGLDRGFDKYTYRAPLDYLHTAWGDRFIERLGKGYYREPWFLLLHLWELHIPSQQVPKSHRSGKELHDYDRSVSSLDFHLGRILRALDAGTFLIITGDHGEKTEAETYREDTAVGYTCKKLHIERAKGRALYEIASLTGPSVVQQLYAESVVPMLKTIDIEETVEKFSYSLKNRLLDYWRLFQLRPRIFWKDMFSLKAPLKLTAVLRRNSLLDREVSRKKMERFLHSFDKEKLIEMQARMFVNTYKKSLHRGHAIHLYDFLVKVPLVLYWKEGLPRRGTHARMIRQVDVMPTVLDFLGVDPSSSGDIDGRSFRALIEGKAWEPAPAFLSISGIPPDFLLYGIRTEDFKYTYGPENPALPEELYDLRSDPGETMNLAGKNPEICKRLRRLAGSLVPAENRIKSEPLQLENEREQDIHQRLRDMGYLD